MLYEITVQGLHEWLLPRVLTLPGISLGSRVLDLGCGNGAWLKRLFTAGFQSLTGVDRRTDLSLSGVCFIQADLDDVGGSALGMFDLITAIEIIEHVANPEALVSLAADHLNPGGWLVITTPNIYALRMRIRFLLTGKLSWFEYNFHDEHLHPLVLDPFRRVILPRYPLSLDKVLSYPEQGSDGSRLSSRIMERLASLVLRNDLPGDTLCMMLRRKEFSEAPTPSRCTAPSSASIRRR